MIEIDNENQTLLVQKSVPILGREALGFLWLSAFLVRGLRLTEADTVTPSASCAISKRPLEEVSALPLGAGAER